MNALKEFLSKIKTFQGHGYYYFLIILRIVAMELISAPPAFPPEPKLFYSAVTIAKYM